MSYKMKIILSAILIFTGFVYCMEKERRESFKKTHKRTNSESNIFINSATVFDQKTQQEIDEDTLISITKLSIKTNDKESIKKILAYHPKLKDENKNNLLHMAALLGNEEMFEFILKLKPKLENKINSKQETPIQVKKNYQKMNQEKIIKEKKEKEFKLKKKIEEKKPDYIYHEISDDDSDDKDEEHSKKSKCKIM